LVLNLHHLPATLTAVVGDGRDLGARVRYSWEQPRVLGSAGGPRLALPLVTDHTTDTFFIINGDTLTDVDPSAIAAAHAATDALVTLALVPNLEFERYGGVALEAAGAAGGVAGSGPPAEPLTPSAPNHPPDTSSTTNGDPLTAGAPPPTAAAHAATAALATLALVPNLEFDPYGGVALDAAGRVPVFVRRGPTANRVTRPAASNAT